MCCLHSRTNFIMGVGLICNYTLTCMITQKRTKTTCRLCVGQNLSITSTGFPFTSILSINPLSYLVTVIHMYFSQRPSYISPVCILQFSQIVIVISSKMIDSSIAFVGNRQVINKSSLWKLPLRNLFSQILQPI